MRRRQSSTRQSVDQSVIGRRGERAFADLCERAGLRIAKPEPDMTGKDFLVEFPFAELGGAHTLDIRPIPLSCYVQVKTIAHSTTRIKLQLKAAERLVKESKPTFIAIVCLDENENISNIRMIHVYDTIIISILKRLRQEQAKKSLLIGNKCIYFNLNCSTPLDRRIQAVRDFISINIGNGMVEYAKLKHKQIVELGYDDLNRYKLNIQFDALSPDEFVDGLLGLRDLPTLQVEHFENRFGIALRADDHSILRSKVKLQPNPAARCRIALTGQSSKRLALLEGDLYFPGELALNVGVRKLLVKSALINVVVDERGLNISLAESQREDSSKLAIFTNSYRMIYLLSSEPCNLNVTIEGIPDMFFPIAAPITGGDTKFFKAMLPVLEAAAQLRLRANAPDTPVYIDEIVQQRFDIMQAHQAFIERDASIYFETGLPQPKQHSRPQTPFLLGDSRLVVRITHMQFALASSRPRKPIMWRGLLRTLSLS
jgi:hypothetical protein